VAQRDAGFQGFGRAVADGQGRYAFRTIRPGLYPGRTPHIHLRVRPAAADAALTTQLYFPDDVNDRAHSVAPYATHTGSRTTNDADMIHHPDNVAAVAETTDGWAAALTIALAG
jgi:protocatechuate 3,4-dioxygenase beta subunit